MSPSARFLFVRAILHHQFPDVHSYIVFRTIFKSLVSTNSTIAACGQLNKSGTKVRDFVDIREDR